MIPLGLSTSDLSAMQNALAGDHSIHITVQVLTLTHTRLADLSWRLLDGQVNIDAMADVTRSCTLSLLDPHRSLAFDSMSPSDGAVYLDRMIQVNYSVKAPTSTTWYTIPLFTGPIVKMDRTDDVVNLECQGKEVLSMGSAWMPRTYKKGLKKRDVVMSILQTRGGETKFSFPEHGALLPWDYSIGRDTIPWTAARNLANGMALQLFYDGRGVARLRGIPGTTVFNFRDAPSGGSTVWSEPQVSYSTENVKNAVYVKGGVPKGAKKTIEAYRVAPAAHPLSPWKLGRNGIPRYLLETIENTSIVSQAEANKLAQDTLNARLLEEVEVKFDAAPMPHLEPYDLVRIYTAEFNQLFRIRQLSIPLTAEGQMSVGYLARVSTNHKRIRR